MRKKICKTLFLVPQLLLFSCIFGPERDNPVDPTGLTYQGYETLDTDGDGKKDSVLYVSPNGDDDNPGFIDTPVKTLNKAVFLAEKYKITEVYAEAGTYNNVKFSVSNYPSAVIGGWNSSFTEKTGSNSVFDGSGSITGGGVIQIINFRSFTFENIDVTGGYNGIYISDVSSTSPNGDLTFKGNIHNNSENGIECEISATSYKIDIKIQGNIFNNNSAGLFTSHYYLGKVDITGDIYNNQKGGINLGGSFDFKFNGNVYNNKTTDARGGGGICIWNNTGDVSITGKIYNNISTNPNPSQTQNGGGISFYNPEGDGNYNINCEIYSNHCDGPGGGIYFGCSYNRNVTINLKPGTIIYGNNAGGNGGGIYADADHGSSSLNNYGMIAGNTSGGPGGGVCTNGFPHFHNHGMVTNNSPDDCNDMY